jgi:hypothetical protein
MGVCQKRSGHLPDGGGSDVTGRCTRFVRLGSSNRSEKKDGCEQRDRFHEAIPLA